MSKGYVYVLSNQALPGLVKIGYSSNSGATRRAQLSTTGLPHPFELVFEILVFQPFLVEQAVHQRLARYRENIDREFFRLDETAAIMAVIDVWLDRTGFESNFFAEWNAHTEQFSPAPPQKPIPTEEEIIAAKAMARATFDGLRALIDRKE